MTNTKMSGEYIAQMLPQFNGGDEYFLHWTGRMRFTEGVQWLAEKAGAYWLIDAVASYQPEIERKPKYADLEGFQLWELVVRGQGAVLTCRMDTGTPALITQKIEFTDFPLTAITLFVEGNVLLLPNEH